MQQAMSTHTELVPRNKGKKAISYVTLRCGVEILLLIQYIKVFQVEIIGDKPNALENMIEDCGSMLYNTLEDQ